MGDDDLDLLHVGHYRGMTTDVATSYLKPSGLRGSPAGPTARARSCAAAEVLSLRIAAVAATVGGTG